MMPLLAIFLLRELGEDQVPKEQGEDENYHASVGQGITISVIPELDRNLARSSREETRSWNIP